MSKKRTEYPETVSIVCTLRIGLSNASQVGTIDVEIPAGMLPGEVELLKQQVAEEWANNYIEVFYKDL